MNQQEVFSKSYLFIMDQGHPAMMGPEGMTSCAYRAPDGSKCAIGCLIPDELYTDQIEGTSVAGLVDLACLSSSGANRRTSILESILKKMGIESDYDLKFLSEMQTAHDEAQTFKETRTSFREYFRNKMSSVAKKYSLEVPAWPVKPSA